MRDEDRQSIRKLELFSSLSDAGLDVLLNAAYVQRFPSHVQLIREGDPADFLYVVLQGAVELFSANHARETTMAMVTPVSTFILAATIKDAPFLMSARTVKPSQLLLIPSSNVRNVFEKDPAFARAIVAELACCYRVVVKSMKNLKLRTAVERVGNYLLRLQDGANGSNEVVLPMGKKQLASMLGMTPENLSRAFLALQSHGVMVDGPRIEILDTEALAAFCRPTTLIDDPNS